MTSTALTPSPSAAQASPPRPAVDPVRRASAGTPDGAEAVTLSVARSAAPHRFMTQDDGACPDCLEQMRASRDALPHGRLMIVAATPVIEAFGGGVETRYLCLDCGHTVMHSTGRFGSGWH